MYKRLKMWLRFFFGFSSTEANGFLVLSILMIAFLLLPLLTASYFSNQDDLLLNQEESRFLDSLVAELDIKVMPESLPPTLENFDINLITADALIHYGLPQYLADRVVKYRSKVQPFNEKEELLKIYGMDTATYLRLSPYIIVDQSTIPEQVAKESANQRNKRFYETKQPYETDKYSKVSKAKAWAPSPFDINSADTSQLKKVKGIGSTYAKRIIAFREALGGYNNLSQLSEVYGLKSPALDSLLVFATLDDKAAVVQLAINQLSAEELSLHPYISKKQAKLLVAYKEQHGIYVKASDLLQINILDSAFVEKIAPYLHFE